MCIIQAHTRCKHASWFIIIEKNIVALMLREFVKFVNIVFKSFIRWPKGKEMKVLMTKFK